MREKIINIKNEGLAQIIGAESAEELEALRVAFLGRKGKINEILKELPGVEEEERRELGMLANEAKQALEEAIRGRSKGLSLKNLEVAEEGVDVTLPAQMPVLGAVHPLTLITKEATEIFRGLGFSVESGPEVEWDEYNFQKLLMGPDHPSRDTQETYYFDEQKLLRTHTSPVQIRYMEKHKPPVRIIVPGMVYRRDRIDATHLPAFYQMEGLMVDDKTTLTDLLGILTVFAKKVFGKERKVRFYGHNFPYTEPSIEAEVEWRGGWMEILGAGMVHPQVLRNVNIDPEKYTGWAFGMGLDRIAMRKYGISDIRNLYPGDLAFLNQ